MAKYPPLWNQAISYPAQLDRSLLGALWPAGGASGAVATAVASTLQVSIPPGSVAVPLQAGQGSALCHWDAAEVVTLDPGPGAGTTRVDVIVAQVRDNQIDGGPSNDWLFTVVKGTAAAAPTPPAVPANALALYRVPVPATAVNLNGVAITDVRPGGLAASGGGFAGFFSGPVGAFGAVTITYPRPLGLVGGVRNAVIVTLEQAEGYYPGALTDHPFTNQNTASGFQVGIARNGTAIAQGTAVAFSWQARAVNTSSPLALARDDQPEETESEEQ